MLLLWWALCVLVGVGLAHGGVACRKCGAPITKLSSQLPTLPDHIGTAKTGLMEDGGGIVQTVSVSDDMNQDFDLAVFASARVKSIAPAAAAAEFGKDHHSFFPGHAWHAVECPVCSNFLGWGFDRLALPTTPKQCALTVEAAIRADLEPQPCLTRVVTGGYWSVEYCHKLQVTQFHPVSSTERNPAYSLGQFDPALQQQVEPTVVTGAPGAMGKRRQIKQEFVAGQHCDETNLPRSTTVRLVCCANKPGAAHQALIAAFREPRVCVYEMVVCLPSLCLVEGFLPDNVNPVTVTTAACKALHHHEEEEEEGTEGEKGPKRFFALDVNSGVVSESSSDLLWADNVPLVLSNV
ncbi:hypothetical protein BASA81_001517 [Batrachochytrium salamandrivorans]|nr:hypothetical protein BASA81_001517 [Batrachochytrium salamandrivorans]